MAADLSFMLLAVESPIISDAGDWPWSGEEAAGRELRLMADRAGKMRGSEGRDTGEAACLGSAVRGENDNSRPAGDTGDEGR